MSEQAMPSEETIREAQSAMAGVAHRTPVLTSRLLDEAAKARLFFKAENLQRTGSFKVRGAWNAIRQLSDAEHQRGVLTYSSGNHAQGLAYAARHAGTRATVIMPTDAPAVKRRATEAYGAEVIQYDRAEITREQLGERLQRERGLNLIPPYDHPHIIAGQATVAMELHEDVGEPLDFLFVCLGGGGLLSGCALATRALAPECRVIGVEPAAADDFARSFHSGLIESVRDPDTIADGARTPQPGALTFPIVRQLVHDIITVDDGALATAMFLAMERLKVVIEPTGALAFAGALAMAHETAGARVGVIISGGNVDFAAMPKYLALRNDVGER